MFGRNQKQKSPAEVYAEKRHKEEIDKAKGIIEEVKNKINSGNLDPTQGKSKIDAVNEAINISEHCYNLERKTSPEEWIKTLEPDCTQSTYYLKLMMQRAKEKRKIPTEEELLKSAGKYVGQCLDAGEYSAVTAAENTMKFLKHEAATGRMPPPDMWKRFRELNQLSGAYVGCLVWANSHREGDDEKGRRMWHCEYGKDSPREQLSAAIEKNVRPKP